MDDAIVQAGGRSRVPRADKRKKAKTSKASTPPDTEDDDDDDAGSVLAEDSDGEDSIGSLTIAEHARRTRQARAKGGMSTRSSPSPVVQKKPKRRPFLTKKK